MSTNRYQFKPIATSNKYDTVLSDQLSKAIAHFWVRLSDSATIEKLSKEKKDADAEDVRKKIITRRETWIEEENKVVAHIISQTQQDAYADFLKELGDFREFLDALSPESPFRDWWACEGMFRFARGIAHEEIKKANPQLLDVIECMQTTRDFINNPAKKSAADLKRFEYRLAGMSKKYDKENAWKYYLGCTLFAVGVLSTAGLVGVLAAVALTGTVTTLQAGALVASIGLAIASYISSDQLLFNYTKSYEKLFCEHSKNALSCVSFFSSRSNTPAVKTHFETTATRSPQCDRNNPILS